MKKRLSMAVACATLLMGGTALGAATWTFSNADSDKNLELTKQEFRTAVGGSDYFKSFDANDDRRIDDNEFRTGFYDRFDRNNDDRIVEAEYDRYGEGVFGDNVSDFDALDANDDAYLDSDEFNIVLDDAGLYDSWDADGDGYLVDNELYDGTYGTLDTDRDGVYTEAEYQIEEDDGWFDDDGWF